MTTIRRPRRVVALALAGALVLGSPLLTGCSLINNFIPGGNNGGGLPGGVIPGQSVPDDFPSEVPLIEGDVLLGLSVPADNGDKAWNVTIKVVGGEAWGQIKQQLTDAGYEYQELAASEDGSSGAFKKAPYTVLVVVSHDQDDWSANYTVTNADTGE